MIGMEDVVSGIGTVGFPIVSFLISAWFIKYSYDKQMERDKVNDEREDKHWQELSNLTAAVNENSQAVNKIVEELRNSLKNQ